MKKAFVWAGKVLKGLLTGILCLIAAVSLWSAASSYINGSEIVKFFRCGMVTVMSSSMVPALNVDDLVVVQENESYQIGDVITFSSGSMLITHRIIGESSDGFITKGDANNVQDSEPVLPEAIQGKMILSVQGLGGFLRFFKTPLGIILLVTLAFLFIKVPDWISDCKKNCVIRKGKG